MYVICKYSQPFENPYDVIFECLISTDSTNIEDFSLYSLTANKKQRF